jgi:hypothetical protein
LQDAEIPRGSFYKKKTLINDKKILTRGVKVGDVVKVAKTQKFPADLLLLDASSPTEVCIETSCFDNDSALRHWQCMPMALKLAALGSGDTTLTGALRYFFLLFIIFFSWNRVTTPPKTEIATRTGALARLRLRAHTLVA